MLKRDTDRKNTTNQIEMKKKSCSRENEKRNNESNTDLQKETYNAR